MRNDTELSRARAYALLPFAAGLSRAALGAISPPRDFFPPTLSRAPLPRTQPTLVRYISLNSCSFPSISSVFDVLRFLLSYDTIQELFLLL